MSQALQQLLQRLAKIRMWMFPVSLSRQKIGFCVTLNPNGSLHAIDDIRQPNKDKLIPKLVVVCGNSKPSESGLIPGLEG